MSRFLCPVAGRFGLTEIVVIRQSNYGGFMRFPKVLMCAIVLLVTASSLYAGDVILYGGSQKTGTLTLSSATDVPGDLLEGDFGGTMGGRFSAGRIIGFEQNFSYSPRFAKPGVKAFQMDSNLLVQAPGKFVPYATAGIGFITTWGQDLPSDLNPEDVAAFIFNIGTKFSVNYGGGIKIRRLLGPVGFNVDVRGYTLPDVYNGSLNIIQTSVGAVITW
jgi:hypothetical protein